MQIWISSSSVEESSPVERFFTVPAVFRQEQVWQMPIRQPNSGLSPAASACSSTGAPSLSTRTSEPAKWSEPSGTPLGRCHGRGHEALDVEPVLGAGVGPGLADRVEQGGRPAGERLGGSKVGLEPADVAEVEVPVQLACPRGARVGAGQPDVRVALRDRLELVAVDRATRGPARSEGR